MKHILFHELARKEFLGARDYYDGLVFGLGKSFVIELERCLKVIKSNPSAYPVIKENIRKALVIKFPYASYTSLKKKLFIFWQLCTKKENLNIGRREYRLYNFLLLTPFFFLLTPDS